MKVLITGGAGYIGSHAAKFLHQKGYQVEVLDNLSRGNAWLLNGGPLHEVDLLDVKALTTVYKVSSQMLIMHFAAYAYVGEVY